MVISMADPSLPDATLVFLIVFSNDPHRHLLSYRMNRVFSPVPKRNPDNHSRDATPPACWSLLLTSSFPVLLGHPTRLNRRIADAYVTAVFRQTRRKEKRSGQPAMNRSKQGKVWALKASSYYWVL